jgi:histidinol dehydrogenase
MIILSSRDAKAIDRLLAAPAAGDPSVARRAAAIVGAVRRGGDRALLAYARRLDGLRGTLELSPDEIAEGASRASREVRSAISAAARRIRRVARRQLPARWSVSTVPGVRVQQRVVPLDRVGCYVPGGRHPLPSSLLMTAIPARVAGVRDVFVACPRPEPAVLAAAREAGATRVFRMGGAQAIAAFAYGTGTVPRVDKIVGPGNRYVAAAKTLVAPDCAIDFHAGPTEVLIVADSGRPEWIAADLIAQAEHDPDARAILITTSRQLAIAVARAVKAASGGAAATIETLDLNGAIVIARDVAEEVRLADRIAPEHLVCYDERVAARVRCAGTIFVGGYSAPAAGDYATGSNHVLPTGSAARFRGGLSAADFVRVSTVQRVTRRGLARLAPVATTLAREEGLPAHARSIEVRLK